MIELRHLRAFVAVAEELSFSRAARRLNLSQPPLSQQIRQLEGLVGTALLRRTTRRIELTSAGLVFLQGARRTLLEAERTAALAQRASRGELGNLRVGFSDGGAISVLPGAIRRFRHAYPQVHLELQEHDGAAAHTDALLRDAIDVAVVRGPLVSAGITTHIVLEEPFCVLLPASHPVAERVRIRLRDLKEQPLVLNPRRLAPMYYDMVFEMCRESGFTPFVAYEVLKYQTMLSLVAAGIGIGIVPRSNGNIGFRGVAFRRLAGSVAQAQVVAAHRSENAPAALQRFLAALEQSANEEAMSARRNERRPELRE